MSADETAGLPRVRIGEREDDQLRLLRGLQAVVLEHPVAAQAAFAALVAEGRRFAETAEGRRQQERLTRSSLLQRARLVFDIATLWMLEEEPPADLPSAYVDALSMAAGDPDMELLLDRLFRETVGPGARRGEGA